MIFKEIANECFQTNDLTTNRLDDFVQRLIYSSGGNSRKCHDLGSNHYGLILQKQAIILAFETLILV